MAKKGTRKCQRVRCPVNFKELVQPTEFVRSIPLPLFERRWAEIGLDDLDMDALEVLFLLNPDGHPIVKGTGGVGKLRFSSTRWNFGKSGGARVYFLYFPDNSIVFWLFVHTKKEIDELSNRGKEQIRQTAEEIKKLLERPA